jgi:Tfp pilus assembly protein PilX
MTHLPAESWLKRMRIQNQNQSGLVLVSSLVILSALLIAGVGARMMLQNDHRTSANLRGGTEAFYLAVSGLEWSKSEIVSTSNFPPAPNDRSMNFSSGNFSVSFISPAIIGPLSAKVIVRSVGTVGVATHTLQAQLTKVYDLNDSAIGLRGNVTGAVLSGSSVRISGIDHDPTSGTAVPGATTRPAISTSSSLVQGLVEGAVANLPQGSVGSGGSVSPIAASPYLPVSAVSQLANDLCASPGALVSAIPAGGSLVVQNQIWGDQSTPQLRCIDGLAGSGDGLTMAGSNSGSGILIVTNADLILTGTLRWEGLIIVTGNNVSFRVSGSSGKNIFGALLLNETGSPASGFPAIDVQGSLELLFSRSALSRSAGLIPAATVALGKSMIIR